MPQSNINEEKTFFCSDKLAYAEIARTKIVRHYFYGNYRGIRKIFSYVNSQRKLLSEIKKARPAVCHFQWFKIPFVELRLLKKIRRVSPQTKIVFTAHNVLPHDSGAKYEKIYEKVYHSVDKIIVHAVVTKDEIVAQFNVLPEKISVIPHGYLPTKYHFERNPDHTKLTFSFIGFLSDYKGLGLLIDAWCGCDGILNNNNIQLVIAGAGSLPCLAKIPAGKNIILTSEEKKLITSGQEKIFY